ncbi:Endonuclease/exonuclease/phosphatase, partial [Cynara cardunculus var. scolymus]
MQMTSIMEVDMKDGGTISQKKKHHPPSRKAEEQDLRSYVECGGKISDGFQEIVPLNAGNVLGTEDNGPAKKWLALIRKTLNSLPGTSGGFQFHPPSPIPDPVIDSDSDFAGLVAQKTSSFLHRRSFQSLSRSMRMMESDMAMPNLRFEHRYSICDPIDYDRSLRWGIGSSDEENGPDGSPSSINYSQIPYSGSFSMEERDKQTENSRYCLVASKQMVGIYLTIWVKSDLRDNVRNMKVSCVGRGLMGYLGNKSFDVRSKGRRRAQKKLGRDGNLEENSRREMRTLLKRFSSMSKDASSYCLYSLMNVLEMKSNTNVLMFVLHDSSRVIWLGDLNYRIALSHRSAKALLRMERKRGRVFEGWNEGNIYFPPTYKYSNNSDRYAGYNMHPREKRRTPAWCDRILWYGNGLHQLSYVRGESRFSDHRPVYSIFLAEVESINRNQFKKNISYSSRIQIEELLPFSRRSTED